METISVGEKTWIVLDEDQIYIRLKKIGINKFYIVLFALASVVECSVLLRFNAGKFVLIGAALLSIYIFYKILFLFENQEIHFDPKSQKLRRYVVVGKKKVKVKILFPGPQNLNFAWMFGRLMVDDNEFIEGYELVAYINNKYHKDLLFFKTNASREDFTVVFKELLSIDIQDRMSDKHSRLVK
jgi:hypothetical protein